MALGGDERIATDVEVLPGRAIEVLAAGQEPDQFEGRMRDPGLAGLPVLDGAHADIEQLAGGDVGQPEPVTVILEALGAVEPAQKLPVGVPCDPIFHFA